uniref:Uncharacterized protein n=1 Tax=Euplotes crassus TaxID=5936 RepID=A0A7S3KLE2_EUPCR|mmetsp:Transcript_30687/g.30204  ORF Transcript_30687/g.30204 Transcript_30687/m.30204 type:complete len:159 (+) Transcript_30687:320-796(+)
MRFLEKLEEKFASSSRDFEITTRMNIKRDEIGKKIKQFKNKYTKLKVTEKKNSGLAISTSIDNSIHNTSRGTPLAMEKIVLSLQNPGSKKPRKKIKKPENSDSFRYAQSMLDLSDSIMNVMGSKSSKKIQQETEDHPHYTARVLVEILKPSVSKASIK